MRRALVKRYMIVDDSWARAPVWPPTIYIMHYHRVSFTLNMFKTFMIVDDSFSRLSTRMIVYDSLERLHYHRLSRTAWPGLKILRGKDAQYNYGESP